MTANEEKLSFGSFTASVDGKPFLVSNSVTFHDASSNYFLWGTNGNANSVYFCVHSSLESETPEVVKHYTGALEWTVFINDVSYPVVGGSATVTIGKSRRDAHGTIDFKLEGGRVVTGNFDIKR
ncbi:hypothetical protein ACIP1X_03785 [Pseudomonas sp. NPDC088885]|uniref:hypothetical protein n=1 Tax=Pseudomonas sp. NPDC088885 TaxID=3364457 RepID=UPI00382C9BF0